MYSFNKSYLKYLIVYDAILNKLFISYCNRLEYKIKILFKRRRDNKSRYSANKVYVSLRKLKHTNTKLYIILYTHNKQKSSIENNIRLFLLLYAYNKQKSSVEKYIRQFSTLTKILKILSKIPSIFGLIKGCYNKNGKPLKLSGLIIGSTIITYLLELSFLYATPLVLCIFILLLVLPLIRDNTMASVTA